MVSWLYLTDVTIGTNWHWLWIGTWSGEAYIMPLWPCALMCLEYPLHYIGLKAPTDSGNAPNKKISVRTRRGLSDWFLLRSSVNGNVALAFTFTFNLTRKCSPHQTFVVWTFDLISRKKSFGRTTYCYQCFTRLIPNLVFYDSQIDPNFYFHSIIYFCLCGYIGREQPFVASRPLLFAFTGKIPWELKSADLNWYSYFYFCFRVEYKDMDVIDHPGFSSLKMLPTAKIKLI